MIYNILSNIEFESECPPDPTQEFTQSLQFSYSGMFSNSKYFSFSDKFSNTHKFSEINMFSESRKFSHTDDFSLSGKFTKSNEFDHTNSFSDSYKFSHSSLFSESEKFSSTNKFSKTKQFSKSEKSSQSELFEQTKAFTFSNQFSQSNEFSPSYFLSPNIHLINCGIFCNTTSFADCSTKGGGGAIYIENNFDIINNATFIDAEFIRCKALYGGAVLISTNTEFLNVSFTKCHFESNTTLLKKQPTNENKFLFSGSAICLIGNGIHVHNCTFKKTIILY